MNRFGLQISTPVGPLSIFSSEKGITSIELNQPITNLPPNDIVKETKNQLDEYFNRNRTTFDLPLDMNGTTFENMVWEYLKNIPYGTTTNYGNIARKVSTIKAVRAVGRANGKNPIPIIVPCHRVIGSNGSLVGYALGLEIKQKLLALENPEEFGKQLTFQF